MTKPTVELKLKESYGKKRFYPICGVSNLIVEFMGVKTFTPEQIEKLKTQFQVNIS